MQQELLTKEYFETYVDTNLLTKKDFYTYVDASLLTKKDFHTYVDANLLTKKDFQIYVNSSDARFSSIERRLDAVELRLDAIESRLDRLEAEFRDFKQEITHLITSEIQALSKIIIANMQEQERKWNEQIRLNQYFSGRISDLEVAAA